MNKPYLKPVNHRSAWQGCEIPCLDQFSFALQDKHLLALDQALKSVRASGLDLNSVEKADFDLTKIETDIRQIEHEILHGSGVVIIRGFPVNEYSLEDVEILYWGLGTYLGIGESQSKMGDRLGHVEDVSGKDSNERAYRNSVGIMLHTDLSDIVGMLSIRQARDGGISTYVSAPAIHNKILATRPELLTPLYRGFRYHLFGEQPPGEPPITAHEIPVLSQKDGFVSARYIPEYITRGLTESGESLPELDLEAFNYFNELAIDKELRWDVMLQPGDLSFINNYTVLHTRDAFFDGEEPHEKRLLLRLWLTSNYKRPVVDNLGLYTNSQGIASQQASDTYLAPSVVIPDSQ
ncbi:MAG: hypothetical protein ACI8P9_001045 [Parasphingorhabdus sp.]|jgi:hypothetical protein